MAARVYITRLEISCGRRAAVHRGLPGISSPPQAPPDRWKVPDPTPNTGLSGHLGTGPTSTSPADGMLVELLRTSYGGKTEARAPKASLPADPGSQVYFTPD